MKLNISLKEILLIRDSLLLRIREDNKIVEGFLEYLPDQSEEFKENTEPFLKEMNDATDLISKICIVLSDNGSCL